MKNLTCLLFILSTIIAWIDTSAQLINAPRAIWHNTIEMNQSGSNENWCYSIIATTRKTYIGVGYTTKPGGRNPMFQKLNNYGRTVWVKHVDNVYYWATPTSTPVTIPITSSTFYEVIEISPSTYAAVGYHQGKTIIVEFDENGNVNNGINQVFSVPAYSGVFLSMSIAVDPTSAQSSYLLCGRFVGTYTNPFNQQTSTHDAIMVAKVDIATRSISNTDVRLYDGSGHGSVGNKILTKLT